MRPHLNTSFTLYNIFWPHYKKLCPFILWSQEKKELKMSHLCNHIIIKVSKNILSAPKSESLYHFLLVYTIEVVLYFAFKIPCTSYHFILFNKSIIKLLVKVSPLRVTKPKYRDENCRLGMIESVDLWEIMKSAASPTSPSTGSIGNLILNTKCRRTRKNIKYISQRISFYWILKQICFMALDFHFVFIYNLYY